MAEQGLAQGGPAKEEDQEAKVARLQSHLKDKLDHKEELVPKDGKGKYNITVPVVFDFLNRTKDKKTIRERKVEAMIKEAKDREAHVASYKFVANDIPRTTKQPLYMKILEANM